MSKINVFEEKHRSWAQLTGRSWQSDKVRLEIPFSVAGVSTAMVLHHTEGMCIVECGDGLAGYVYSLLGRKTELYGKINAVILTHEHLDHCGGLAALLGLLRVAGRKESLDIITPCGSTGTLSKSVKPVIAQLPFDVKFTDSLKRTAIRSGGIEIESFRTRHRDSFPANRCGDPVKSTGYSISVDGARIVFSGDTGQVKELGEKCSGADLAVIESTWEEPSDCEGLHLTVKEAKEYAMLASDGILMHPLRDREGAVLF